MTTINKKGARPPRKSKSSLKRIGSRLMGGAVNAGWGRVLSLSTLLAFGLGGAVYYGYVMPMAAADDRLRDQLAQKRKQNAIARMVQETRPAFLDEFRRVIDNYRTARELLPGEAEVSNVLAAIQQTARANSVRVTMFDASRPGAKSTNPAATAAAAAPQPDQAGEAAADNRPKPQITLNERVMPAQIQGSHANVARFLSDVAKFPRIIYVRDFSITGLNGQENVNLTLVTYDAPTSGILPPIPAELGQEFQGSRTRQARPVNE